MMKSQVWKGCAAGLTTRLLVSTLRRDPGEKMAMGWSWSVSKDKSKKPADAAVALNSESRPQAGAAPAQGVGWRLATFASECLVEDQESGVSITAIWDAYLRWCGRGRMAPLSYPLFVGEFTAVVQEAGIPRRQIGANVVFPTVGMR
ncbi:hypothetical protein [Hyphomicrobium sp. DY-1]|uniref:hypothetical protein n=1 Tax=Hyphomicrobium sp. DY-1 TaxID=3075650 RepID=UPI0039C0E689